MPDEPIEKLLGKIAFKCRFFLSGKVEPSDNPEIRRNLGFLAVGTNRDAAQWLVEAVPCAMAGVAKSRLGEDDKLACIAALQGIAKTAKVALENYAAISPMFDNDDVDDFAKLQFCRVVEMNAAELRECGAIEAVGGFASKLQAAEALRALAPPVKIEPADKPVQRKGKPRRSDFDWLMAIAEIAKRDGQLPGSWDALAKLLDCDAGHLQKRIAKKPQINCLLHKHHFKPLIATARMYGGAQRKKSDVVTRERALRE